MRFLSFAAFPSVLYLLPSTHAATIPSPITLNPSEISSPFNLSISQNVTSSLSAPPPGPYPFDIPGTNMGLLFTSFGALLPSQDVFSTMIDATLVAIDGMVIDGKRLVPAESLSWQQGAAQISISHPITYDALANTLAALSEVSLKFGSITQGLYATRFQIYAGARPIAYGQIASRPPAASLSNTNPTTTTARSLMLPPDPFPIAVPDTPVTVIFSAYRKPIPKPVFLDLFLHVLYQAAGVIRDSRGDAVMGHHFVWRRAAQFNMYPKMRMSWRNLAEAIKGMKTFVLRQESLDFRFQIGIERWDIVGMGRVGILDGKL